MARKNRHYRQIKPLIYVFCEGLSEQAYISYIKERFQDVCVIRKPFKGNFQQAYDKLRKDPICKQNISEVDEVWFFFDAEHDNANEWTANEEIINKITRMRKGSDIKVRLLMTTGCVEYWFLLHYRQCAPQIYTPEDKERVLNMLKEYQSNYEKGDPQSTRSIAENYETAIANGQWTLKRLADSGDMPDFAEEIEQNAWLFRGEVTFTTVHEAIEYLKSLEGNS